MLLTTSAALLLAAPACGGQHRPLDAHAVRVADLFMTELVVHKNPTAARKYADAGVGSAVPDLRAGVRNQGLNRIVGHGRIIRGCMGTVGSITVSQSGDDCIRFLVKGRYTLSHLHLSTAVFNLYMSPIKGSWRVSSYDVRYGSVLGSP